MTSRIKMVVNLRKAKGLSQFRLSQITGVSRYRISLFECGYAPLTEDEFKLILDVLQAREAGLSGVIK